MINRTETRPDIKLPKGCVVEMFRKAWNIEYQRMEFLVKFTREDGTPGHVRAYVTTDGTTEVIDEG